MTEEVKQEEGLPNEGEQQEVVYTETEQEALAQGWVPKDQFQGDPNKWVDAGEFNRRGELFTKIETQSREVKELRKALHNFKEHHTKVKEAEYNRALETLKKQFKLANRNQEFDLADQLEEEIEAVQKEAAIVKQTADEAVREAEQIHPEFASWVAKNTWYAEQPHMRKYADDVGVKSQQLGLSPREVLQKVQEAVKKEFPNKFINPNRERPGAVEGSTTRKAATKDDFKLSEQETTIMNSFINMKGKDGKPFMTKEEYIADLKKTKGVA
jgi:multidrug efflux pump subunit AcrB